MSVKRLSSFLNADELQTDARVVVEKPNLQLGDEVRLVMPRGLEFLLTMDDLSLIGFEHQARRLFVVQGRHAAHA